MSSIWKDINIDYNKFYVVQLDKFEMNFSKTSFVMDRVINRPFNNLKDAKKFKKSLRDKFQYTIVKKRF